MKALSAVILLACFLVSACSIIPNASKRKYNPLIRYVGVMSTSLETDPAHFPRMWTRAIDRMETSFPGNDPMIVWTIGAYDKKSGGVTLGFPADDETALEGNKLPGIGFLTNDPNRRYLKYFNKMGIAVFFFIEPGNAPVERLIGMVLERYTNFSCVAGLGIDADHYAKGAKITDTAAETWEKLVKSFNTNYRLILKGENADRLPRTYRGDIIFMSDRAGFRSVLEMAQVQSSFADRFYPNLVFFAIGNPADRYWWSRFKKPQERIGDAVADRVRQECGFAWSDATLKESLLK